MLCGVTCAVVWHIAYAVCLLAYQCYSSHRIRTRCPTNHPYQTLQTCCIFIYTVLLRHTGAQLYLLQEGVNRERWGVGAASAQMATTNKRKITTQPQHQQQRSAVFWLYHQIITSHQSPSPPSSPRPRPCFLPLPTSPPRMEREGDDDASFVNTACGVVFCVGFCV